jgi:cupin 2 domain-containing protein
MMKKGSILDDIPGELPHEFFEDILKTAHVKIERIVSFEHSSPQGFWYDQETSEWVILLEGSAGLLFEGEDRPVELKTGDYINIPAHVKHRVEWTAQGRKTLWLAIHYAPDAA